MPRLLRARSNRHQPKMDLGWLSLKVHPKPPDIFTDSVWHACPSVELSSCLMHFVPIKLLSIDGIVDHGVWLRISRQYLSFALVRVHGNVFRHYYCNLAKSAGKDFCDGAVVPF
jgi:hypothetical protein